MPKCSAPQGWSKRPSVVTILGPRWPKRASAATGTEDASPGAQQKPRSPNDYSRLSRLFTSRLSPQGPFLATPRHFRGPFWPAAFRIRRHRRGFWPSSAKLPSLATSSPEQPWKQPRSDLGARRKPDTLSWDSKRCALLWCLAGDFSAFSGCIL